MPSIAYSTDERPAVQRIVELYRAAQLRRPVDDPERIARTYEGSPIVLSAWDAARLVGILRGWTDGAFDGYVCDLAVDPEYQNQGVGRELLRLCVAQSPHVQWVLRASVIAADYYAHLGWVRIENGWFWGRET
jgi:ribosomal protein S18 acetylase RimI-like enzyme